MRPDSAIDHIKALATTAKDMWSMDTGEWELRARSRARSAPHRKITLHLRPDWRTRLRTGASVAGCIVGVAMIAVALGLALRGDAPSVVSTAAADPVAAVAPPSGITVTPIDVPAERSGITVTPIDEPAVAPIPVPAEPEGIRQTTDQPRPKKRTAKKSRPRRRH